MTDTVPNHFGMILGKNSIATLYYLIASSYYVEGYVDESWV
jgi:hypothetical protein